MAPPIDLFTAGGHFRMHTERYVGTFIDRRGRDITVITWATSTTKQNARRKAERFFRRIAWEQGVTSARAASA